MQDRVNMHAVKNKAFGDEIETLRASSRRALNDSFYVFKFAISKVEETASDESAILGLSCEIPDEDGSKTIRRTPDEAFRLLTNRGPDELRASFVISAVARMESFLGEFLTAILKWDRARLAWTPKSGKREAGGAVDGWRNIELSEVLRAESLDDLVATIVARRLGNLFYAGPAALADFTRCVARTKPNDQMSLREGEWTEIKATRDILVHGLGIANEIYRAKAGGHARAGIGQVLSISNEYCDRVVWVVRGLIQDYALPVIQQASERSSSE